MPGLPEAEEPATVAAVDGGGGVVELVGGQGVYIARAYGYVEEGEPERLLELRLVPARDTRVLDALRSWVEHRAAVRLVLRLPRGSLLLMDGSYWVSIVAGLTAVARLAAGRASSLATVYTAVFSGHAVAEAARLAEIARSRGVTVAYVSKDHGLRALKEKVLLEAVAEAAPGLRSLVEAALEWYPLVGRSALLEARGLVPREARWLLDAALDQSYTDPRFIADAVGPGPGYSWVLRLPPPRRLHRVLERLGPRGLAEKAAEKALEVLAGPEAGDAEALRDKLPRVLDQLPAPRMLYARLGHGDEPLLVEVPGEPGSFHSPGRVLEEPRAGDTWLVAALASRYGGSSIYYNIPLVAAHMNATLDSGQLAGYASLLERLAAARGIALTPSRRLAMATRLPTRRRRRRTRIA